MLIPGMIVRNRKGLHTWDVMDIDAREKNPVFFGDVMEHPPKHVFTVLAVFHLTRRKERIAMVYVHDLETFTWCWEASNWEILVRPVHVPRGRAPERTNKKGTDVSQSAKVCKR